MNYAIIEWRYNISQSVYTFYIIEVYVKRYVCFFGFCKLCNLCIPNTCFLHSIDFMNTIYSTFFWFLNNNNYDYEII